MAVRKKYKWLIAALNFLVIGGLGGLATACGSAPKPVKQTTTNVPAVQTPAPSAITWTNSLEDYLTQFTFVPTKNGFGSFVVKQISINGISLPVINNYLLVDGPVNFPDTWTLNGKTYKISAISSFLFYGARFNGTVNIPNTITEIMPNAFEGAVFYDPDGGSQITFTIPKSVEIIGSSAFQNTEFYQQVVFAPGANINVEDLAFNGAKFYKAISLNGINSVGISSFFGCLFMDGINFGGIQSIGNSCFQNTSFFGSTTIQIPQTVKSWGNDVFMGATFESGVTFLPGDSITTIPGGMFQGVKFKSSFLIPNGVKNICANAFMGASFFKNLTLPNGLQTIDQAAFQWAFFQTGLTIPSTVNSIATSAFNGADFGAGLNIEMNGGTIAKNAFANVNLRKSQLVLSPYIKKKYGGII